MSFAVDIIIVLERSVRRTLNLVLNQAGSIWPKIDVTSRCPLRVSLLVASLVANSRASDAAEHLRYTDLLSG